jgi:hypothetical protein
MFAFVNGQRELTVSYVKELHAALLQHQQTVTVWDQFGREFDKPLAKGATRLERTRYMNIARLSTSRPRWIDWFYFT